MSEPDQPSCRTLIQKEFEPVKVAKEKFRLEDSLADLAILYKVKGFKDEVENLQFWDNYQDFR